MNLISYKSLIRLIFIYNFADWELKLLVLISYKNQESSLVPNAALSLILKPQTLENSVLRVPTGCVKITSIVLLQEETKVLPIQDHLSLQCSQYLARTVQPNNPSHNVVTSHSGFRNLKYTLQSQFLHSVAQY